MLGIQVKSSSLQTKYSYPLATSPAQKGFSRTADIELSWQTAHLACTECWVQFLAEYKDKNSNKINMKYLHGGTWEVESPAVGLCCSLWSYNNSFTVMFLIPRLARRGMQGLSRGRHLPAMHLWMPCSRFTPSSQSHTHYCAIFPSEAKQVPTSYQRHYWLLLLPQAWKMVLPSSFFQGV